MKNKKAFLVSLCMSIFMLVCSTFVLEPAAGQGVRKLILGQVDGTTVTRTVRPCTTMGFSVESSLTLPATFASGKFLRVDRTAYSGDNGYGYVLVDGGGPNYIKLAVFNLDTMALVGTTIIQAAVPGKYRPSGRYAGETSGGSLYLGLPVRNGGGSCSGGGGNDCISISKYTGTTFNGEGITAADATDQIDDMRFADSTTLIMVSDNPSGALRRYSTFSSSSLALIGHGANTTFGSYGRLSQAINGFNYAAFAIAASPNAAKIAVGANVATSTFTFNTTFGGRLPATLFGYTGDNGNDYIVSDSDVIGSAIARRGYVLASTLVNTTSSNYNAAGTDGAALYMESFYDSINNFTYVFRGDGGSGLTGDIMRITPGPTTFTVGERFACGGTICTQAGGFATGTQTADFSERMARLFVVNTDNPAVVSKIKVCATGGP